MGKLEWCVYTRREESLMIEYRRVRTERGIEGHLNIATV